MADNVPALRMCRAIHDHPAGMNDSIKVMKESQKTAKNTKHL